MPGGAQRPVRPKHSPFCCRVAASHCTGGDQHDLVCRWALLRPRTFPSRVAGVFVAALLALSALANQPADETNGAPAIDIPFTKYVLDNGLTPHRPRGHEGAGHRRQRLVPRRLEEREARQDRVCAPLRAPDVQRHRELPRRVLRAVRAGGRHRHERHHQQSTAPTISRWCRRTPSTWRCGWNRTAWGTCWGWWTRTRLDEQRGVVQNEKRQRENQPYGRVWDVLFENIFPAGHPYAWSVIGSMEDLNAATSR